MASIPTIGLKGLKTSGNPLTYSPGGMTYATNCVLFSKDEAQVRRGQPRGEHTFGTTGDIAYALTEYADGLVVHQGPLLDRHGDTLEFASSPTGSFTPLAGTWEAPDAETLRMKFAQLARNLYWTSSRGLGVLDGVDGAAREAGVTGPPVATAGLSGNPGVGWLPEDAAVAYRCVFGRKDENNNVKLSAPSGRVVVVNPEDVTATLTRSGSTVTATTSAGHGFNIDDVLELSPGSADFLAGNYTVTAVTATTIQWTNLGTGAAGPLAAQTLSSGSKYGVVSAVIPDNMGLVAGDFVQVYRTDTLESYSTLPADEQDPGDEEALCYERTLTATEISNRLVTVVDTTPEIFLGQFLYTNATSGQGLAFAKNTPPLMNDVCVFDGRLFGGETEGVETMQVRLLSVGSPNGAQSGDLFAFGEVVFNLGPVDTYASATQNVDATVNFWAANISRKAFSGYNGLLYVVPTGDDSFPFGGMTISRRRLTDGPFYAAVSRQSAWQNALPLLVAVDEGATTRTSNVVTVTTTTSHGFSSGDYITLAFQNLSTPDDDFPPGIKGPITVTSATTFTYAETGANETMVGTYFVYANTFGSERLRKPVRFSEPGQPEAWPLVNIPSGLPERKVLRVLPLRGVLYVFFEEGDIYSLSGQYPYTAQKYNGSATLFSADSLVEHAESLFCLTTQGVTVISESGIRVVSLDIETELRSLLAYQVNNGTCVFGLSYQSDRQYQLWLNGGEDSTNSVSTLSYIFQSNTGVFTKWEAQRTCGITLRNADSVNPTGELAVYGTPDGNWLRFETKTYDDSRDYYDDAVELQTLGILDVANYGENKICIEYAGNLATYLDGADSLKVGSSQFQILDITAIAGNLWEVELDGTPSLNYVGWFTFDAGAMDRTGGNTVNVLLDYDSGLMAGAAPGGAIQVGAVTSASADFPVGAFTFATVLSSTQFTYTQAGANVANTQQYWFSRSYTRVIARWAIKPLKVGWIAQSGGAPGIEKQWRELQLHFGQQAIQEVTVSVTGEREDTAQTVTVQPGTFSQSAVPPRLSTERIQVPQNAMRQAMLEVTLTFADVAGQRFTLLGNSMTTEGGTERTPR